MTGVYIALVAVSVLSAALIVALIWEEQARRHWKGHDAALERRVAVDEALLDRLRGSRRGPDVDDPTRRTR